MSSSDPTTADLRSKPENPQPAVSAARLAAGARTMHDTSSSGSTIHLLPRTFGHYELLAEIGRGGMGVVFTARQRALDRVVALKMILPGSLPTDDDLQRFRVEAEAAARLQHRNIVAVHEVGEIDGQHYYTMDYIEGPSLGQRLKDGPLPGRTAARYVLGVAQGIQHAHRHQILHRDIKPSNILLSMDDEPHVTDFGLAKKLGDSAKTRTGAILGTPSYMAPEQAAGKTKELGPACDVYGMGALLYELLTGRPPFRAESAIDTLMQVLDTEPAPPRLLNPRIDRDLQTICMKCLEKDIRHRYPTAEALAEDLRRYLNGESISARSSNMLDRLSRTLDHSQHDVEFHGWGTMLLWFAPVVFAEHLVIFFLTQGDPPYPLHWMALARVLQFIFLGIIYWRCRAVRLTPPGAAERQLWSIWLGYLVSCGVIMAAERIHTHRRMDDLTLLPIWAVLSGLAYFIMGSNYWGRCYAYGVAFFILALLMPLHLKWAALEFGGLWAACLVDLGLRLRRLGGHGR